MASPDSPIILDFPPLALSPIRYEDPVILNWWTAEGKPNMVLIETSHDADCCDPFSVCKGRVRVGIVLGQTGSKISFCTSCGQPVEVNTTAIQIGLNLFKK